MRFALEIAYDGKSYHGWQVQSNAHSIQTELETALEKVIGVRPDTVGCGRTDTGVHARQYFLHFDFHEIEDAEFIFRLNKALPDDISAKQLIPVKDEFHARFSCASRKYEYWISRKKNPFLHDWAYYRYGPLKVDLMNEAAQSLLSYSNFQSFSKSRTQVKTFICRLVESRWEERDGGDLLVFHVRADRFLRNMVRAMVGTLLDVGKGAMSMDEFREAMESRERTNAGLSVPAKGLYLAEVRYEWNEFLLNG